MSIQTTNPSADVTDRAARKVGQISVTDTYQEEYLPLILNELRRISILLARMGGYDVNFDEEFIDVSTRSTT